MEDLDLLFDDDLDLAQLEDEFEDDDDLDLDQLMEVAETVEQQHLRNNISFVDQDAQDPTPPAALPESTPCFHPFDSENLRTYVYPTNYPVRSYQLNIVRKAMFNNTLVALPTGLGKTFIAAVVMFNYYRWFPNSKVVFMAPTRPLVTQQIEACFSICGLPQSDTTELMGTTSPAKRRELWKSKRVFFATPQTVQKDLETKGCPADRISCVVVDEAHRASGNYAYTQVIRKLYAKNKDFRVLALTATPGSTLDAVQDVIDNLHITNIQIRTEDSMDIREYTYGKQIERRIVRLDYTEGSTGALPKVIHDFQTKVLLPMLEELARKPTSVVASIAQASSFGLRASRLHFTATAKNLNNNLKFYISSLFLVAEDAARSNELLCAHGIVPFLESIDSKFQDYKNTVDEGKKLTKAQAAYYNHSVLNAIVRECKAYVARPDFVGHPKLEQLTTILLNHFTSHENSKVMVFSSWRSSVADICNVINRHSPIIRGTSFVGQASDKSGAKGLKQSEQQDVIQKFKKNQYNVLVSTSIGEEGLDIGELDLIICFDSQTSPIRMLQRMGRTGRKRQGRCILLLTEAEEKKFSKAKQTYEKIQSLIARGGLVTYYKPNPTILPNNYKPTICRKAIEIGTYQPPPTKKRKRATTAGMSAAFSDFTPSGTLKPDVESGFAYSFGSSFVTMDQVRDAYWPVQKPAVNKYMPLQTRLQSSFRVGHAKRTERFVNIVQKIEHQIIHPGESFHAAKPTVTKLVLPSKAKKKEKQPAEDFDLDFGVEDLSWEPMLTDSMFDKQEEDKFDGLLDDMFNSQSQLNQSFGMDEPLIQSPVLDQPGPSTSRPVVNYDEEEDEFDDELLDDLFFDNPELLGPPIDPFDDPLDTLFPFEQSQVQQDRVKFVWVGEVPKFSEEGMKELERRQEMYKKKHGRYLTMKFIPKYKVEADVPIKEATPIREATPSPPRMRSPSLAEVSPPKMQSPPRTRTPPRMKSPPRKEASPVIIQDDSPIDNHNDEEEFGIDFSQSAFANFLENKFSDDEGQPFPTYLFEQDQLEEPIVMWDFNQPFSQDSGDEKSPTNSRDAESPAVVEEDAPVVVEDSPFITKEDTHVVDEDPRRSPVMAEDSEDEEHVKRSPVVVIESQERFHDIDEASPKDNESSFEKQDSSIVIDSSDEEPSLKETKDTDTHSPSEQERVHSVVIYSSDEEEQHQPTPKQSPFPNNREDSESPLVHRRNRKRHRIPSEDEQGSPVSLLTLSKGIFTPSPFRSDTEASPLFLKRKIRRRPVIEEEDEEEQGPIHGKKRLKQNLSSESFDDEFEIRPTSFLQRLEQTKEEENPFIDDEAEKSEDGGHTEEEVSDGSSLMNSFIDDNSSADPSSRLSNDDRRGVYGMMDTQPLHNRHWMNKFNADKWLNAQDDQEIVEEEEEEEEIESIQDFSSNIVIEDDDFM